MRRGIWVRLPLARKIGLLFGTAVLLTIAATLTFPWVQMSALNEQAKLIQAKRVASAAYQSVNLFEADWSTLQLELAQRWPALVDELGLPRPPPQLVRLNPVVWESTGFRREAAERLTLNPRQQYYWRLQDRGRVFRFAMAVRATDADLYPDELIGLIDVTLPAFQEIGTWNLVVTALAGASGAVLATLVFYLVAQRLVLSRVESLRNVAVQVGKGDRELQSAINSGDEFQDLSEAFNDMLRHLRAAEEEQRTINRSLDVRLGELAETNVALYESNRVKSEFLANVSHELRTPLVSIIGFAELLRDAWENPNADRARLARYTENILSSGRSLLELINDLLDLAKIEAGRMELHVTEFSIAELGEDLVDFVRPLADKRRQNLSLQVNGELPRMRSDSGKIKQILYNLLSNGIKFTPEGGAITLRIENAGQEAIRLSVTDTGPGIPSAQKDAVFEKFRQLDSSKTREFEGTGLGLAITKELVQILGGNIRLESEEGQGTTVTVDLPTAPGESPRSTTARKMQPVASRT